MVAKFFNKTKPVNTVINLSFLLFLFVYTFFVYSNSNYGLHLFGQRVLDFVLLLFNLFLILFIIRKNNLTKNNSYAELLIVLFIGMFPTVMINTSVLISNLVLLFAFRRIYSLRTGKDVKEKLFDSSFLIGIATLLHPWTMLYILLIYVGISVFQKSNMRTILIPLVGFITPLFLYWTYTLLVSATSGAFPDLHIGYNFSNYNSLRLLLPLAMVATFIFWTILPTTAKIYSVNNQFRDLWVLILYHLAVSVVVMLFAGAKDGSETLFLFFPVAVIITNYLQQIKEKWFKEVVLLLFIFTTFFGLIYSFSP